MMTDGKRQAPRRRLLVGPRGTLIEEEDVHPIPKNQQYLNP